MIKKQRSFWMDDCYWRKLNKKIEAQGISGRGKLERFMEKVCDEVIIFISGEGNFKIIPM